MSIEIAPPGDADEEKSRHLVMVMPGGLQRFFEELTLLNRGLAAPDLVRVEKLMNEYGVELLRPPLS